MKRIVLIFAAALCLMSGLTGVSYGKSSYATSFKSTYPSSPLSSLSTVSGQAGNLCTVCHGTSGTPLNAFGSAYSSNGRSFSAIQNLDSDSDGFSNLAEINSGTFPGNATSTPGAAACTGYTYSAWSGCGANGQQTRTVTGNTPANCTGTPTTQPVLTQACTPPPAGDTTAPVVTAFNIQAVSNTSNIAIIEFTATDAAGVTGYMTKKTSTPPTAQDAVWQATPPTSIKFGGQGVKTVYAWAKDAAGNISETASATVVITRNKKGNEVIPAPSSQEVFSYNAIAYPEEREDIAKAKPLGIGKGGDVLDLQASMGPFDGPVDVYITLLEPSYAGSLQPSTKYYLRSDNIFEAAISASQPWQQNVTDINEHIADIPVADLVPGPYILLMTVTPAGMQNTYYQWVTPFVIR